MFRFSIRELVLVTVIAALGVVWWMERSRSAGLTRRVARLEGEVQQSGVVIKSLYEDLESIEKALPAHGAGLVWSREMRPTLQRLPAGAKPAAPGGP